MGSNKVASEMKWPRREDCVAYEQVSVSEGFA